MSNPVIVIPCHKPEPTPEETVALLQCQKILGDFPIFMLHPSGMKISKYETIFPRLQSLTVSPEWMGSISAYNKLMISPFIFNALNRYTHILIHEPDAIVLKNELLFWCNQNFDYIGAPWFNFNRKDDLTLKATGNFGLSLIKVSTVNNLFLRNPRWYTYAMITRDLIRGLRGQITHLNNALFAMGQQGKLANAAALYKDHCDVFWSYLVPKVDPHFLIAPPEKAILFAWETHPDKCQKICKGRLPFGIHAWSKYDPNLIKAILSKQDCANLNPPIRMNT